MNRGQPQRASAARRRRLRRCRAAGILVGGSVQRPSQTVLVGDLPQWAALGVASEPACVLGLDVLGTVAVRAAPDATSARRRGGVVSQTWRARVTHWLILRTSRQAPRRRGGWRRGREITS